MWGRSGSAPVPSRPRSSVFSGAGVKPAWFHHVGSESSSQPHAVTQRSPRAVSTSGLAEDRMIKLN